MEKGNFEDEDIRLDLVAIGGSEVVCGDGKCSRGSLTTTADGVNAHVLCSHRHLVTLGKGKKMKTKLL